MKPGQRLWSTCSLKTGFAVHCNRCANMWVLAIQICISANRWTRQPSSASGPLCSLLLLICSEKQTPTSYSATLSSVQGKYFLNHRKVLVCLL